MEVREAIHSRRSVRDFIDQHVPKSMIDKLLDAAVQAPSAMNAQPWRFVVIQNKALLQSYSDRSKELCLESIQAYSNEPALLEKLRDPTFNVFYNSGTLILICATLVGQHPDWDCCFAAQNLMLAALEIGLGTCPIGLAWPLFELEEVKRELSIPTSCTVVLPMIVGFPSRSIPPVVRAKPRILSWK